jgi:hypothetical protein
MSSVEVEQVPGVVDSSVKKVRKSRKPRVKKEASAATTKASSSRKGKSKSKSEAKASTAAPAQVSRVRKTNITVNVTLNSAAVREVEGVDSKQDTPQHFTFSPAKIKNVVANYAINREVFNIQNSQPDLENLPQEQQEFVNGLFAEYCQENMINYAKGVFKNLPREERDRYTQELKQKKELFESSHSMFDILNGNVVFDIVQFNREFGLYKDYMADELNSDLVKLLLSRKKIRFNNKTRIYITLLVEYIVEQMLRHSIGVCLSHGKKIIKIDHLLESRDTQDSWYPLMSNLSTWTKLTRFLEETKPSEDSSNQAPPETKAEDTGDEPAPKVVYPDWNAFLTEYHANNPDHYSKYSFQYYISELCKKIRLSLQDSDNEVENKEDSKFNRVSISYHFKTLCSDLVIDFLVRFGELLKNEVVSRNIKTINFETIKTNILFHYKLYGLESQLGQLDNYIRRRFVLGKKDKEEAESE